MPEGKVEVARSTLPRVDDAASECPQCRLDEGVVPCPFFKADRIRTPTLFLCGEKDFNVPITGSEQMYQALKSLGVDTQLVVHPGRFHGLEIPSYERDKLERYLKWWDRYLK